MGVWVYSEWVYGCMAAWLYVWMDAWVNERMSVWGVWVYGCMRACMQVCMGAWESGVGGQPFRLDPNAPPRGIPKEWDGELSAQH